MINAVGRDIPDELLTNGKEVYQGKFHMDGKAFRKAGPTTIRHEKPQENKLVKTIREACGVAKKLNVNHETLRIWVRRAETDAGQRPGLTTDERVKLRELERENKELRRANEILKAASAFFARELDPRLPK